MLTEGQRRLATQLAEKGVASYDEIVAAMERGDRASVTAWKKKAGHAAWGMRERRSYGEESNEQR